MKVLEILFYSGCVLSAICWTTWGVLRFMRYLDEKELSKICPHCRRNTESAHVDENPFIRFPERLRDRWEARKLQDAP